MARMDARRWGFVGMAFLVGLLLGAALLFDGSPVGIAGSAALVVEVLNAGPRVATGDISVSEPAGGGVEHWTRELPVNETARFRVDRPPSGQLAVRVHAQWSGALDGGQGQTTTLVRPSECREEALTVRFTLDTSRGVAFGRTTTECA